MELRKDPITQSWVILGQREVLGDSPEECPLEPAKIEKLPSILTWPAEGAWQVRVIAHPEPLYHIEGEASRSAEGMYDKMRAIGAHEVVVETPAHEKRMSQFSDEEIESVLWVWASRIADLKKDARFKYVSVFKNQGAMAGEEWKHAHSQVTATIFVPRRIKYELSAAHEWFKDKERCIFCDTVRQEEKHGKRIVDVQGEYYALCPYASRVPYEIWLVHRRHNHLFEQGAFCGDWKSSRRRFTWWCTRLRAPRAKRANYPATGRRWPKTTTGTSKSCRSWRSAASPTASKRCTSMRSCRSRPRRN
jgi:UDPglucose--hexose-1-phosphate uridylyltransferase